MSKIFGFNQSVVDKLILLLGIKYSQLPTEKYPFVVLQNNPVRKQTRITKITFRTFVYLILGQGSKISLRFWKSGFPAS